MSENIDQQQKELEKQVKSQFGLFEREIITTLIKNVEDLLIQKKYDEVQKLLDSMKPESSESKQFEKEKEEQEAVDKLQFVLDNLDVFKQISKTSSDIRILKVNHSISNASEFNLLLEELYPIMKKLKEYSDSMEKISNDFKEILKY